jgi:hypothetical protein
MTISIVQVGSTTQNRANSDGLHVKYGTESARDAVVGASTFPHERSLSVDLNWTRLGAFSATAGVIYGGAPLCGIPTTAIITRVTCVRSVAWSTGSSPTLTLGLVGPTGLEIDEDGLLITGTAAHINTNDVTSEVGALVNYGPAASTPGCGTGQGSIATIASSLFATAGSPAECFVFARVATANFTAGRSLYTIFYIVPATHAGGAYTS